MTETKGELMMPWAFLTEPNDKCIDTAMVQPQNIRQTELRKDWQA